MPGAGSFRHSERLVPGPTSVRFSQSPYSCHCERMTSEDRSPTSAAPPRPARHPRLPRRSVRIAVYVALIVVTLAVNFWAADKATQVERIRVPFSPFFLAQVQDGNVAQITSRGTAIQGVFRRKTHSPAGGPSATRFATEIPAFANTAELSRLLREKGVVVNAEPLDTGGPWWESLLLGF